MFILLYSITIRAGDHNVALNSVKVKIKYLCSRLPIHVESGCKDETIGPVNSPLLSVQRFQHTQMFLSYIFLLGLWFMRSRMMCSAVFVGFSTRAPGDGTR
ncbi:hypothetical protein DPMN_014326 [Dreissena polymorpha]|uniref:Uncharacterized protein n=1 Tax=Dreissena polymorpha TaxID=45954 RepID=A0A9D4N5T5_DREPO|nr:hypothetical protein DPMN_014326 [Dreissena polymorpha]